MKKNKTEKWVIVPDVAVRSVWRPECTCAAADQITMNPDGYEVSGTPICPDCGADFLYIRTEILT